MKLTLWLVPHPEEAAALDQLIASAAARVGSPPFHAHVTLGRPRSVDAAALQKLSSLPQLELTLTKAEFGFEYFHSCFLNVAEDAHLIDLATRCSVMLGAAPPKHPPHLSLAYGGFTRSQRESLLPLIPALPRKVRFDGVQIWDTSGDVCDWQRLASCTLDGEGADRAGL